MFKNPNNSSSLFPIENFFGDINNILYNSEVIISWADENMCFLNLFNNYYKCKLLLTEYRLILIPKLPEFMINEFESDYFIIPIYSFYKIEKGTNVVNKIFFEINIESKNDFRVFKLFLNNIQFFYNLKEIFLQRNLKSNFNVFAFKYKIITENSNLKKDENFIDGFKIYNIEKEFLRQGVNENEFIRLLDINKDFKICETYPELTYNIVTENITINDIINSSNYRIKNRFQTLCYYDKKSKGSMWRSSQNKMSITGVRNLNDEKMFKGIKKLNENKELYIFDARPYLSALANRIKGGGFENSNYYECKLIFCEIDNIHDVRNSFNKLKHLILLNEIKTINNTNNNNNNNINDNNIDNIITNNNSDIEHITIFNNNNFFSEFENTLWPKFIFQLITKSIQISKLVKNGNSVLIHCSDGWDRASQLTALSQLFIDPYYRTIEGFIVLVEKEFISFGHNFRFRLGIEYNLNENEMSPVFLQFLDCVSQILFIYPTVFEFNMNFLIFIVYHLTSGKYGTFLCNNEKERKFYKIKEKTVSIWTDVYKSIDKFTNNYYNKELNDNFNINFLPFFKIRLWEECYLRYIYKNSDKKFLNLLDQLNLLNEKKNFMEKLKINFNNKDNNKLKEIIQKIVKNHKEILNDLNQEEKELIGKKDFKKMNSMNDLTIIKENEIKIENININNNNN